MKTLSACLVVAALTLSVHAEGVYHYAGSFAEVGAPGEGQITVSENAVFISLQDDQGYALDYTLFGYPGDTFDFGNGVTLNIQAINWDGDNGGSYIFYFNSNDYGNGAPLNGAFDSGLTYSWSNLGGSTGAGSSPIPDPTVSDVSGAGGYVAMAIVVLGTIAALVLGGFFSFWLIKKTMAWAHRIG